MVIFLILNSPKGSLSPCKRPSFALQKAVNCNTKAVFQRVKDGLSDYKQTQV